MVTKNSPLAQAEFFESSKLWRQAQAVHGYGVSAVYGLLLELSRRDLDHVIERYERLVRVAPEAHAAASSVLSDRWGRA